MGNGRGGGRCRHNCAGRLYQAARAAQLTARRPTAAQAGRPCSPCGARGTTYALRRCGPSAEGSPSSAGPRPTRRTRRSCRRCCLSARSPARGGGSPARPAVRSISATRPVSTEGWTRRVHFVREGGGGSTPRSARRAARVRSSSAAAATGAAGAPRGGSWRGVCRRGVRGGDGGGRFRLLRRVHLVRGRDETCPVSTRGRGRGGGRRP